MKLQSDRTERLRRENALALSKEAGTKAKFAEKIGRSAGQVGHLIGKTPTKNIGKELARHIEKCFEKPKYWLDEDHSERPRVAKDEAIQDAQDPLREEAIELIDALKPDDIRQFLTQLTEELPLADAAWAASLFADRVKRGLEEP